jgi:hypothetical protein
MGCVVSNEIKNVIKHTLTPTNDPSDDLEKVENYAKAVGMDDANKKILTIAVKDGWGVATKTMMETADNDYFKMRMKYG